MHLCALAEDLGRARGRRRRARYISVGIHIPPRFPPLSTPFPSRIFLRLLSHSSILGSTPRSVVLFSCFPLLSSLFDPFPPSSLEEHPSVYRGGTDGIIVRRGPRFLRGANKTGLRASARGELWARARARRTAVVYTSCTRARGRVDVREGERERERVGRNIAPRLVGIGYRGHSVAVASFLAHYWPPAPISLRPSLSSAARPPLPHGARNVPQPLER